MFSGNLKLMELSQEQMLEVIGGGGNDCGGGSGSKKHKSSGSKKHKSSGSKKGGNCW